MVGIDLGATASAIKVQKTCRVGREEECQKVKFTEGGKFTGAVSGGWIGGEVGAAAAVALCTPFAAAGGVGALACGLVVVVTGSIAGGKAGESIGEITGELIYKETK